MTVSYELEIPDEWEIRPPCENEGDHLVIDGKYYMPNMEWLEYKGKDEEGFDMWEAADDEAHELITDCIRCETECSIRKIKKFSMPVIG